MNDEILKIKNSKWDREFNYAQKAFFTIRTDSFIIQLTGGCLIIRNIKMSVIINQIKGYNYLYTGDVKPDEKELFALENGKHFYIVSLEDFKQRMRITLPRSYEALDVYGSYSEDGKILYIPVYKYVDEDYKYRLDDAIRLPYFFERTAQLSALLPSVRNTSVLLSRSPRR